MVEPVIDFVQPVPAEQGDEVHYSKEHLKAQMAFNLHALKAKQVKQFNNALKELDVETLSVFYARMVTRVPAAWGNPADPETYGNLSFIDFQRIAALYQEALVESLKN